MAIARRETQRRCGEQDEPEKTRTKTRKGKKPKKTKKRMATRKRKRKRKKIQRKVGRNFEEPEAEDNREGIEDSM